MVMEQMAGPSGGSSQYALNLPQDRLVRKEVALGTIREILPPQNHIGLQLVPFLDVESDDVIFDYTKGFTDGLAPARAEDAESELAQKDTTFVGQGRAALIDWAIKDHYSASDVTRYREALLIAGAVGESGGAGVANFPLTVQRMLDGFSDKLARDTAIRRRKLDNRIEWLIMTAIELGLIAYNDGKIKFTVDYQRPAGQHNQAPPSGLFSLTTSDPIRDILTMQQTMYDTYGVRMTRAITSRRVLNSVLNSDKFVARSGFALPSGSTGGSAASGRVDPYYLIDGWGPDAAVALLSRVTNVQFTEYNSVYRTRPIGSNTVTNNKFLSDNKIYFLPDENDVAEFSQTEIGFAKTLTSPHPMGNWQSGWYEWERDTIDPWGYDVGTGIKAFPVFPHMELTYTMTVL